MTNRFETLDGWRGISILLVLAGHLLPLGPRSWQMNGAIAATGMAIFFILSGFLITTILLRDQNIFTFLIRRFMRIIPLAWPIMLAALAVTSSEIPLFRPHLLFYANWEPVVTIPATSHFWSLCVEMQFYVMIAALVLLLRSRVFVVLPLLCIAATGWRYSNGIEMSVLTQYRIDEILAGCLLALIYRNNGSALNVVCAFSPIYLLPLLIFSAHPYGGSLAYLRPYLAMLMIGSTLLTKDGVSWKKWLTNPLLVYIASISYALYLLHGVLRHTWLGDGDTLEKYAKRPLLLAATFVLAHISTFYYEKHFISWGKKLTSKMDKTSVITN